MACHGTVARANTTGTAGPQQGTTAPGAQQGATAPGTTNTPAPPSALSTGAGALIKWDDLVAQSGAGPELDAYLKARNISRTATLAFMGADIEKFKAVVVTPWAAGYTDPAGTTHKPKDTADAAVSEAILVHMWLEARRQWQAHNQPIAPVAVARPATPSTGGITVSPAPPRGSDKPPKDFPQWADQIELYNKRLLLT